MRKIVLVDKKQKRFSLTTTVQGKRVTGGDEFFLFQVDGFVSKAEFRAGSDLQVCEEFR